MLKKMRKLGRLELFKTHRDQPDDEVTLDHVVDKLVIAGTPESVAEQLLGFREEVGDFGELVYAGLDWVDPTLAKRSMELMAQKVMPDVNAALGSDGVTAATGCRHCRRGRARPKPSARRVRRSSPDRAARWSGPSCRCCAARS